MTATNDIAELRKQLSSLRGKVRSLVLLTGVATLIISCVLLCYLSLLVDRFTGMDVAQRLVFLILAIGTLAWVGYRHLLIPLKVRLDEDTLCLRVEGHNPELGSSLISSLQLARLSDPEELAYSPSMVTEAIRSGGENAAAVDFEAILNREYRDKRVLAGAVAFAVFIISCLIFSSTMSIWFSRNILLSGVQWPKQTELRVLGVQDGILKLPAGDDLTICVEAESAGGKVVPAEADLYYRSDSSAGTKTQSMGMTGGNQFRAIFKGVTDPFEFKVIGGDDETAWVKVILLPRPSLAELLIRATPPAYTGEKTKLLPPGQSVYELLKGTTLQLEGTSTHPLSSVRLSAPGSKTEHQVSLNGQSRFLLSVNKLKQGTYGIMLTDTEGITAKQQAGLLVRLRPDAKPQIRMRLKGISDIVLARAILPLDLHAHDDYAIVSAALSLQVANNEEKQDFSKEIELPELVTSRKPVRTTRLYDLLPLSIKPDSHVMLKVTVVDNDAVTGPKKTSSSTLALRVVTEEEFRGALLRREQSFRREFDQIFARQKDLLEQVRIKLSNKETSSGAVRKRQQRCGKRIRDLAGAFSDILDEVKNNRLEVENGPTMKRLSSGIIAPLFSLAAREMDAAVSNLAGNRLVQAEKAQVQAIERMKEIRNNMVRSESFQEAVNILRSIIERQKLLRKATEKEADAGTDDIFDQ